MALYQWSQTAASNGSADPSAPFPEGMAPSAVNDSARGVMAAVAKYRDDIAGAIVTAGTSTAYTVATFSAFDTLAHMSGQVIAFSPHATNGATVTLNVDGLGAKPLRTSPGVELLAGTIIQGTPYVATYNNSDGAFYLQGFYSNPYNVPLLAGMDFWDTIAPNSSFIFPAGQAISRTTYAAAFARLGTIYGAGDGSTTFNVPDKTGRVSAMKEATATRLTTASGGVDGGTMGANGGVQSLNLAVNQIPAGVPSANPASIGLSVNSGVFVVQNGSLTSSPSTGGGQGAFTSAGATNAPLVSSGTIAIGAAAVTSTNASQANVKPLPPMIVCNYIMRII